MIVNKPRPIYRLRNHNRHSGSKRCFITGSG